METLANIKGLGKIVQENKDFYSNLLELKEAKAELITPRDEAYARVQTKGKEDIGKYYGTWTTAGLEYAKKELPILRLESRLLDLELAKQAVEANRNDNYFSTGSTKEYEESLKQAEKDKNKEPIERKVIILPSRDNFTIDDTQNWEVLEAVLKDQAKPYFELNGPLIVYLINKDTVDRQKRTLLTQMVFLSFDLRSDFYGHYRDLVNDSGARGVRKESAEGTSQKVLPYTKKELEKYLNIVQDVRKGKLPNSKLEEVLDFFKEL